MYAKTLAVVALCLVLAAPCLGLTVSGTGEVTDWGVTPFSQSGHSTGQVGNIYYTLENNYSPIAYPSGIGHVPSPGLTAGGEPFDLEEMYLRFSANQMQILVVTSTAYASTVSGTAYHLGDLFLAVDGEATYGVVTQAANQGLEAGSLYSILGPSDVMQLEPGSRSYAGYTTLVANDYGPPGTVASVAGPWAVKSSIAAGQWLGTADLATASHSYGGSENGTFLIEYTLDSSLLGLADGQSVRAQMAWGCGNDVIRAMGTYLVPIPTQGEVPEPVTALGLVMSVAGLGLYLRRRPM